MDSILVVEDCPSSAEAFERFFADKGYSVTAAESVEEAINQLDQNRFSLVLSDLKLGDRSGIELLSHTQVIDPELPFILMTAFGSVDIAVEAMQMGAADFVSKPFYPERLEEAVKMHLRDESGRGSRTKEKKIFYRSATMQKLIAQADLIAATNSSVLITGESGTGKELLARRIHRQSNRKSGPFLSINCAAVTEQLLESEFFGHIEGAFTGAKSDRVGHFEAASEGTIFLDEIGDMPYGLQVKLLRALQESEIRKVGSNVLTRINTRVISATNSKLKDKISLGVFREDLYFRLGVIVLNIPPLRERPEDIIVLVGKQLNFLAGQFEKPDLSISNEALKLLEEHPWPGNVRELENVLERAVVFSEGEIRPEDIHLDPVVREDLVAEKPGSLQEVAFEAAKLAEISMIRSAMLRCGGNKSKCAKQLKVSYKTLLNKIKLYGI